MTGVTCDTSVLVPAVMSWHQSHEASRAVVEEEVTTLIGHVLAETFSTSSRMPKPFRSSPASVMEALSRLTQRTVALSADRVLAALDRVTRAGLSGGATYDALIAACAVEHDLVLLTLDARAARTYEAIGAQVRFLESS